MAVITGPITGFDEKPSSGRNRTRGVETRLSLRGNLELEVGEVVRISTGGALPLYPLPQLGRELLEVHGALCRLLRHCDEPTASRLGLCLPDGSDATPSNVTGAGEERLV